MRPGSQVWRYNLTHHGFMGMTVLDPHGYIFDPYVEGIDRYTYWVMPGILAAAGRLVQGGGPELVLDASHLDLLGRGSAVVVVRGGPVADRGPLYRASGNISTWYGTAFRVFGSDRAHGHDVCCPWIARPGALHSAASEFYSGSIRRQLRLSGEPVHASERDIWHVYACRHCSLF